MLLASEKRNEPIRNVHAMERERNKNGRDKNKHNNNNKRAREEVQKSKRREGRVCVVAL